MARSKSYKRYASGGNPRNLQLAAGLRPMEEQTNRKVRQLEKLAGQQNTQSREYLQDMRGKLSREADNRKEVYEIEEVTPRKLRAEALKNNNIRQQENFKQRIKDQEDLAQVWADLSPTLARTLSETASTTVDFFQKRSSVEEYNQLVAQGDIIGYGNYYGNLKAKGTKLFNDTIEQRAIALKKYEDTGKIEFKQEADYLGSVLKLNNPHTRNKVADDIEATANGIVEDLIANVLTDENGQLTADHKDIASHIQFRGAEILYQLGIDPKSEAGLKIQKKFRSVALTYEHQWSLKHEHASETDIINTNVEALGSSATYEDKNNAFKNIFVSLSALPEQNRSGVWTQVFGKNKISEFESKAKELLQTPKYASNWELFKEEVLGKTLENPLGYVIVGAKGDLTKKHNRLLGKHPNLESRLLLEFEKANKDYTKAKLAEKESKDLDEAAPFIDKVNSGYYKNVSSAEFNRDFNRLKRNQKAVEAVGQSLAFSDDTIKQNLLTNTLFTALRSGNTRGITEAWVHADESNQDITWAHNNLAELAQHLNKPVNELDDYLRKQGESYLTTIIKDNPLNSSRNFTVNGMEYEMAGWQLSWYLENRNRYENTALAWQASEKELRSLLGIGEDGTLEKPDPQTNIRGKGQFMHRVGKTGNNDVIFLSKAGTVFNNTSSAEISAMVEDDNYFSSNTQKIEYLVNAVLNDPEYVTDETLLEVFSTPGHPTNNPLLMEIFPHLESIGLSKKDFLDRVGQARKGTEGKELFVKLTGKDWCETAVPETKNIKNPSDALMKTCFTRYTEQLGLQPWEAAMLGSSNIKVREYIIRRMEMNQ